MKAKALVLATGLGVLAGIMARYHGELGWAFALLVLSAAMVAIFQQTLPWGPNAVYGIASSDVYRSQGGGSWVSKAIVYTLSSALAGLALGALLGALGGWIPPEVRFAVGSVLAVMGIVTGGLEIIVGRVQPPQFDRETPQRWMHKGPLRWAIRNGSTLGVGATTRIGFFLWYVVPLGALLTGDPVLGAVVYGTYGFIRAVAAPLLLLVSMLGAADFSDWLVLRYKSARVLAAGQLIFLGAAVAVSVGL
jgi:hypothetical protein